MGPKATVSAIIAFIVTAGVVAFDEGQTLLQLGASSGLSGDAAFLLPTFGFWAITFVVAYLFIRFWRHDNGVANDI